MNTKNIVSFALAFVLGGLGVWYFMGAGEEHMNAHHHDDEYEMHELIAKEPVRADGTFTIVTSFYPLQFAMDTLTEGLAEVENIGEGQDPHDVQLTTENVRAMQDADLVVLQGTDLEPWGDDAVVQLRDAEVPVFIATHDLELMQGGHDHNDESGHEGEHGDEHEYENEEEHKDGYDGHDHGDYDPHTWLDPVLFAATVEEMVHILETLDPENAVMYEERGTALMAELKLIDAAYEATFASCTLNEVITSHDAFGYVGERYGFQVHTIAGLSTQDTPSAQTLAELREEAAAGVSAILLEENSIAAYGETLAAETGLRTLSINPIAYLIPAGENYLTMMETNRATFADALECN